MRQSSRTKIDLELDKVFQTKKSTIEHKMVPFDRVFVSDYSHALTGMPEHFDAMLGLVKEANSITSILAVMDHFIQSMGYSHYAFCGQIHIALKQPTAFFAANMNKEFMAMAGYSEGQSNPHLDIKHTFLPFVPPHQIMPFFWETGDFKMPSPALNGVLERAGVMDGVTFVERGISQDVICVTLMNSKSQKNASDRTVFAMHGMVSRADLGGDDQPLEFIKSSQPLIGTIVRLQPLQPEENGTPDGLQKTLSDSMIWSRIDMLASACMDRVRQVVQWVDEPGKMIKDDPNRPPEFSAQEINVGKYLVAGLMAKVIAEKINCSTANVNYHIRSIYKKLGVRTRGAAVAQLQIMGIGDKRTGIHI